ncbi:hypothetical protein B0J15DRAFT_180717 [Fusarium solani]|uniref:Uncharacterized protein n=1 Tax=Fusarium solani TaxID=169388 RepID=A0A9P9RBM0_FUSSL|nr:uncharacterized protein B0J15DRAFT_180717 [Fusarium solani]KAH7272543.1 hypothetical protein B0J15DRAFT_180717 [Fusarium solani]
MPCALQNSTRYPSASLLPISSLRVVQRRRSNVHLQYSIQLCMVPYPSSRHRQPQSRREALCCSVVASLPLLSHTHTQPCMSKHRPKEAGWQAGDPLCNLTGPPTKQPGDTGFVRLPIVPWLQAGMSVPAVTPCLSCPSATLASASASRRALPHAPLSSPLLSPLPPLLTPVTPTIDNS